MTPIPITFEVHVAARAIAKRAVVEELKEAGVRVTLVFPAEINKRAMAYIATHPEIWAQALERARKIEEMEEARKAARRKRRVGFVSKADLVSDRCERDHVKAVEEGMVGS
jgi:hypothetical protein